MINKITLGSLDNLKTAIDATGLFASVVVDGGTLSCYDADGHLCCTCNNSNNFTAYASDDVSQSAAMGSGFSLAAAYVYTGAIIFFYSNSAGTYSTYVMMSRTNTGAVAITFSSTYGARLNCQQSLHCIAYGDTDAISVLSGLQNINRRQIGMLEIPTNSAATHTTNAFYMPYGNLTGNAELEFTLENVEYFTTGYWVITEAAS